MNALDISFIGLLTIDSLSSMVINSGNIVTSTVSSQTIHAYSAPKILTEIVGADNDSAHGTGSAELHISPATWPRARERVVLHALHIFLHQPEKTALGGGIACWREATRVCAGE